MEKAMRKKNRKGGIFPFEKEADYITKKKSIAPNLTADIN